MQGESVRLNVHIPRTVVGAPGVKIGPQLRLVRGDGGQQVRFEGLLGQLVQAVPAPDVAVLVVEEVVPTFAHLRAMTEVVQLQVGEDYLQHIVIAQRRHRIDHCVRVRSAAGLV